MKEIVSGEMTSQNSLVCLVPVCFVN